MSASPIFVGSAGAESYVPISGAGSTWSQNALDQWIADVNQFGMRVNYAGTGSSDGRSQFLAGTVDFAASDIPFQSHPTDGSAPENPNPGSFAYIPVTAGGTSFMYNLSINGTRVTNLRLSGQNIAKIFSGQLTNWSDPAIVADNPQLSMPNETIVPVVRSDGSGSSFQFSAWMISQFGDAWTSLCNASGRAPACGPSSYWPTTGNMIAQNGDLGVAGYVSQSYAEGSIGYVEYSYALNAKFPVAKMLNAAGYYTEPTPNNVAVSLVKAQVDTTDTDPSLYLTQRLGEVYTDTDPRAYPLSSYSYMILPTTVQGQFSTAKGKTLGAFAYYAMCQGQQESASLGYSPMPYNLVQDTFDQIKKIPGEAVPSFDLATCNNPTIDPHNSSDPNLLATTAPQPAACDKQGPTQCATGTGGAKAATPLNGGSSGGASSSAGGGGGASGSAQTGGGSSGPGGGSSTGSAGSASSIVGTNNSAAGSTLTTRVVNGHVVTVPGRSRASSGAARNGANGTAFGSGTAAGGCDPSSGTCGYGSAGGSGSSDYSGGDTGVSQLAGAVTTTVPEHTGWTSTQTLMVLIGLLLLGLVLAPGVVARVLSRSEP